MAGSPEVRDAYEDTVSNQISCYNHNIHFHLSCKWYRTPTLPERLRRSIYMVQFSTCDVQIDMT